MLPSRPTGVAAAAGPPAAARRRARIASVLVLALLGLAGLGAGQAHAAPLWGPATPAAFAAGVESATPNSGFGDVSCASAGNCTAVGTFLNADAPDAHVEAFAQTQTAGRWGAATPLLDDAVDQTQSQLAQVSCASAGDCTAVGLITHEDGSTELLALTQTDGAWGPADLIAFPPGSTYPAVTSMSCASAGNCTAVGYYGTPGDEVASFAVTQADGAWGALQPTTFVPDPLPLPAGHYVRLASVSCASAGNCTAAGTYGVGGGGRNTAVFTQTQVDGNWGLAEPVMLPLSGVDYTQGGAWPTSISCATAASCTLVGTLRNGSGAQYPFMRTRTDGDWGPVALPAFAGGYEYGGGTLSAVSCSAAGDCTAVGDAMVDDHRRSFAVTQTGGSWGDAELASFAPGVEAPAPDEAVYDVSCAAAGDCTAVGYFLAAASEYSGEGFAWTQADGVWGQAAPARFADGLRSALHDDSLGAVSCPSDGGCTAVGLFLDAEGGYQAFAESNVEASAPVNAGGADAPTIAGTAMVGETLTAGHGTWSNPPASESAYAYEWQVSDSGTGGWTAVTGADPSRRTLVVPAACEGRYLRVQVTAHGDLTSEPAYSAATAQVRGRADRPARPRQVRWAGSRVAGGLRTASFAAASGTTYVITAVLVRSARAARVVHGVCRIRVVDGVRTAVCMIRLPRAGVWRMRITPIRNGVAGAVATQTVRVAPARPAPAVTG